MNKKMLQYWLRFSLPTGETGGTGTTSQAGATGAQGDQQGASTAQQGSQAQEGATDGRAGGVEALRADLVGERQARQAIEQQFADLQKSLQGAFATITGQPGGEDQGPPKVEDLAQIIQDLQARLDERDTEATNRVVTTEIRAAAQALGFHNPDDALPYFDEVETAANGEIDKAWLEQQVKAIAEERPYLLKSTEPDGGWRNRGAQDAGIGGRGGQAEPTTPRGRIEMGLAAKSVRRR